MTASLNLSRLVGQEGPGMVVYILVIMVLVCRAGRMLSLKSAWAIWQVAPSPWKKKNKIEPPSGRKAFQIVTLERVIADYRERVQKWLESCVTHGVCTKVCYPKVWLMLILWGLCFVMHLEFWRKGFTRGEETHTWQQIPRLRDSESQKFPLRLKCFKLSNFSLIQLKN